MESLLGRITNATDRGFETHVTVGAAVLLLIGLLAVIGTAVTGATGPVADAGLAATAVGVAGVLFGLGEYRSRGWRWTATAGLVLCVLAVGVVPFETGVGLAIPGGVWGIPYAVGVALLVTGGVVVPSVVVGSDPASEASPDDVDDEPTAAGVTATITRTPDGDWTWRLTSDDGEHLASAPRPYENAAATREAVRRLNTAIGGDDLQTVTRAGGHDDGSVGDEGTDPDDADEQPERPTGTGGMGVDRIDVGRVDEGVVDRSGTAVFEVANAESGWRWRLRYGDDTVVATAGAALDSEAAARRTVDRVQETAPDAGVLTYDPAAFEVYPRDGDWAWRLRRDGAVVAVTPSPFESRGEAMAAIVELKDATDGDTGVETERSAGGYRWRLGGEAATAVGTDEWETEAKARDAFETVRSCVADAGVLVVDPAGFAVGERTGGGWGWRLRDPDGSVIAESPAHANRDRAVEGLRTVQRVAPHAEVSTGGSDTARAIEEALSDAAEARSMAEGLPDVRDSGDDDTDPEESTELDDDAEDDAIGTAIEVFADDPWGWRLRHDGRILGSVTGFHSRSAATEDANRIATLLATATVVTPDPATVQVDPAGEWWRLVDRDGKVVARAAGAFDRGDARRAAEAALDALGGEPETYREDGWRWRLRGEDGLLAVAGRGFESVSAATEAYEEVVENAAGAPVVECDTAIELADEGTGWRWRLRDGDGRVVDVAFDRFESRDEARRVATGVVEDLADREDPVETTDHSTEGSDDD